MLNDSCWEHRLLVQQHRKANDLAFDVRFPWLTHCCYAQGQGGFRRRLHAQPRKLLSTYSYKDTVPFSYIDWAAQGMVTPVKDQGQVCNTCELTILQWMLCCTGMPVQQL